MTKPQAPVVMYTKVPCPFCDRAKNFFKQNQIQFEEIDLTNRMDELLEIKQKTGWATVPIILIGGKLIGGYTDMKALADNNELQNLLFP